MTNFTTMNYVTIFVMPYKVTQRKTPENNGMHFCSLNFKIGIDLYVIVIDFISLN
jgi:hypothetical protein